MAWKEAWSYASKWVNSDKKEADAEHREAQREDAHLPLGARIGSVLSLQKSPFLQAQFQGSLVEMPRDEEALICAISRVKTSLHGDIYRYYLHTGDDTHAEKFVQIYVDKTGAASGAVREVLYCSGLLRLSPDSVQEQEAFLGEAGYGLGERSFSLWRGQIADLGFDEARLSATFIDQESVVYQRDIGDSELDFVAPIRGVETRIDNAAGTQGLQQQIIFMPYSRVLGGEQREILLISTEIIESEHGDRAKHGIYVDFMIGIPIDVERLVVQ